MNKDDGCNFIAYNRRCDKVADHEGPHRPILWGAGRDDLSRNSYGETVMEYIERRRRELEK